MACTIQPFAYDAWAVFNATPTRINPAGTVATMPNFLLFRFGLDGLNLTSRTNIFRDAN